MAADPVLPLDNSNSAAALPAPGAAPAVESAPPAETAAAPAPAAAAAPSPEAVAKPEAAPAAGAAPAAAAAEAAKPAEPVREKTLLEKFDDETKKKEAEAAAKAAADKKPADAKAKADAKAAAKPGEKPAEKAAEAKPVEAKAEDKPVEAAEPAPVAYEYKLPDTIKMDDALKGEFHAVLDGFRADPEKGAQGLVDLHNKTMQMYAEQTLLNQFKVFNDTKAEKEKEVLADPEIGGAGHQTAMTAIARARDLLISSAKPGTPRHEAERKEFDQFLKATGAGSWPAFLRLLHNGARYTDEPQAHEQPLSDLKPPKGNGRQPGSRMYDHPTSQRAARS